MNKTWHTDDENRGATDERLLANCVEREIYTNIATALHMRLQWMKNNRTQAHEKWMETMEKWQYHIHIVCRSAGRVCVCVCAHCICTAHLLVLSSFDCSHRIRIYAVQILRRCLFVNLHYHLLVSGAKKT